MARGRPYSAYLRCDKPAPAKDVPMRAKRSGGRAKIALTESGRRFPDQALTTTRTDAMNRPNKDRNRKHLVRDCSHPLLTDKLPCKAGEPKLHTMCFGWVMSFNTAPRPGHFVDRASVVVVGCTDAAPGTRQNRDFLAWGPCSRDRRKSARARPGCAASTGNR